MKVWLSLILALLLTGCTASPAESTVPAAETEAIGAEATAVPETTVPETTQEPTDPATLETVITVPGGEKTITMELFDGGGYVLYLPPEEWTLETGMEDGYLTDCWTNIDSTHVTLRVIHYGTMSEETVEKLLLATETAYHFGKSEQGYLGGSDPVHGWHMGFRVQSGESGTYAVVEEYPMSSESVWGPGVRAVLDSFQAK